MLQYSLLFALLFSVAVSARAADSDIKPGQYVRDGNSGTLIIRKTKESTLSFGITSVGGNQHTCHLSGVISGAIGQTDGYAKCKISFSASENAVIVRPTEGDCHHYCGMRAGFDGTYRIPSASCTKTGKQKMRDSFMQLYNSRQFAKAIETLQSLMAQCKSAINWIEIDQIRNDLAIAQYHKGEFEQCLSTLGGTLAASVKDIEELRSNDRFYLPPDDFSAYVRVAEATWYNKALCSKAKNKEQ
jgi:hypothetical protein